MPSGNYNINLNGTTYNWANGVLNTAAPAKYKGNNTVTGLTVSASGAPIGFTVTLSHGGTNYTFVFSGGPGPSSTTTVAITYPSPAATTDSDTWDATAAPVPPDCEP